MPRLVHRCGTVVSVVGDVCSGDCETGRFIGSTPNSADC